MLDSSMLLLKLTCFLLPVSRRIQTSPPRPPSPPRIQDLYWKVMDGGEGGGEALGVRSEQLEQGGLIELVVAKAQDVNGALL